MTLRRAVGLRTLRSVFAVVAALLAVLAAPVRARSGAAPLRAVVEPATARDGWFIFPVRVLAEGGPVLVVMPSYTGLARLEVNGALRARAGSNFINVGPFGHGVTTFRLADVHPRDRVVIETNSAGMPRVVEAYDFPVRTFGVGFLEGAYYAVFLTVAIIQLAAFLRTRDTFRLWYVAFVASLVGCELARDGGVLGMSAPTAETVLLIFSAVATVAMAGFCVSYLRLRKTALLIMWSAVVGSCVPAVTSLLVGGVDSLFFVVPEFVLLLVLIFVADSRRRKGFEPAIYVIGGLIGLTTVFGILAVTTIAHIPQGFLMDWGVNIGSVFDVVVFSAGVSARDRFTVREQEHMARELQEASEAASHDSLTGLLNRRGLDAWLAGVGVPHGTLLFVDVDNFKAVNDGGGHARGDQTLRLVARVLRHHAQEGDVVARLGGDEFLVVLVDSLRKDDAVDFAERIASSVSALRPLGAFSDVRISLSIGAAEFDGQKSFEEVFREADEEAYREKAAHQALFLASKGRRPVAS